MKKILIIVLWLVWMSGVYALQTPDTENYILNEDAQQVLNTQGINDPLRDGAFKIVHPDTGGSGMITSAEITDHQTAKTTALQVIKNVVNYALGLLSLVALVYLIYNGFLILTAGLKSIKNALVAIAGIGASWLIVSVIFRLLSIVI